VRILNKKITAGVEMFLMLGMFFSFCYFIDLGSNALSIVSAAEGDEEDGADSEDTRDLRFRDWIERFRGGSLIENMTRTSYAISSSADGVGCCFISSDGQKCGTASPDNCVPDSPFAEGSLCAETSFCQKGCCFDESLGVYDKNSLRADCPGDWTADPNCNMPGAALGCCVLGGMSIFETQGQCRIDTVARALGDDDVVDWRGDVGEGECFALGVSQMEGACLLGGGNCEFTTEEDCFAYSGDFREGYLCSSSSLETDCEMTRQTSCRDEKDGVYFMDSCGNYANIYDASRVDDVSYWNEVVEAEDLCGNTDFENGNAESETCGNCNRFAGGICGSADEDGFSVDVGSFYCRDTSCMFDGESYDNGESWCVYDGAIGEGDDVVGSRHWKYVCSQGVVTVEPCADYRNQICIQTNTFGVDPDGDGSSGEIDVEFRNAACVANNWRNCVDLNSDEDGMEVCAETLNCRIDNVNIADKFNFDVCLPKYPGGFSLSDERYQTSAERLCGMADQKCTVIQKPKRWGGCEYVANENCLHEVFGQEMNDFCRGLGDCGGSVNIMGEFSENYVIRKDGSLNRGMYLSGSWIERLRNLASPVPGQFAEVEDYSEYLAAAGVFGGDAVSAEEADTGMADAVGVFRYGLGGVGMALGVAAQGTILGITIPGISGGFLGAEVAAGYSAAQAGGTAATGLTAECGWTAAELQGASMAGFAGAAMGAGIGMVAGGMIANYLGLSDGGSLLMSIGGGMIGAAVMIQNGWMGASALQGTFLMPGLWIVGIALIVISLFFGSDDCPPIEVDFECKPWKAPVGVSDCDACNGDDLKPCSQYRCESLGAGCTLVNEGSENEMCDSAVDDGRAPVLRPQYGVIGEGEIYDDITDSGFGLAAVGGGCIDAYTPLMFGIVTEDLSHCKFDVEQKDFEELSYDLGPNAYIRNHTTVFSLPDPSHGVSQGADWTGDLSLFVKCRDVFGHESPGFYEIDVCVNEGPDRIAPRVASAIPANDGLVGYDVEEIELEIVTNELAECRWSLNDVSYDLMENDMVCMDLLGSPTSVLGYSCRDSLSADAGTYYIRCADQPWMSESERNFNLESFVYTIRKPEERIAIDWIMPDRDFEISTDMTTIELEVATSDGGEFHFCSYSFSGYDNMIEMFETGNDDVHSQILNRATGRNEIFVECYDETGDFVRSSAEFRIVQDSSSPVVARVWQNGGRLHFVTSKDSECRYSNERCSFAWEEGEMAGSGEEHSFGVVRGKGYYIKCKDDFGNMPSGCSVEVRVL